MRNLIRNLMILTVSLTGILFISGCVEKVYTQHDCPAVEPLKKVKRVKLYTDENGKFTVRSSYDAKIMLDKYEAKEEYYDGETMRLKIKVDQMKEMK